MPSATRPKEERLHQQVRPQLSHGLTLPPLISVALGAKKKTPTSYGMECHRPTEAGLLTPIIHQTARILKLTPGAIRINEINEQSAIVSLKAQVFGKGRVNKGRVIKGRGIKGRGIKGHGIKVLINATKSLR